VVYVTGLVVGRALEVELLNDVNEFEELLELVEDEEVVGEADAVDDTLLEIRLVIEVEDELLEFEIEVIDRDDVELELLVVDVVDEELVPLLEELVVLEVDEGVV